MVYTIAAYTITIGTLALYAVMIQYRQRIASAKLAETAGVLARDPRKGFNVGAALIAPFWMWSHGLRVPGVVLLALTLAIVPLHRAGMTIPTVAVAMIPIAAGAALGFAGNRIAADHLRLVDLGEFASSQLPWAVAGIVLTIIVLPWVWFFSVG